MDYSYFSSGPQQYQYYGVHPSPNTPQHIHVDQFGAGQPQQPPHFNSSFPTFPEQFQYDPSAYLPHAPAQSQLPSRPTSSRPITNPPSISPAISNFESGPRSATDQFAPPEDGFPPRSSSEEKDSLTPQQSKRKAQNRAAQRAFRERKEKHLKDLETKLDNLQQQSIDLDSENERLRKELARVAAENKALRASSSNQPSLGEEDDSFGPLGYKSGTYASDREQRAKRAQMFGSIHTIVIDDNSGEILLNSGQTWDYIQGHQSFRDGLIDVGDVIDQLKRLARSDGQGPVYRESDIRKAISESAVAGGRDEL